MLYGEPQHVLRVTGSALMVRVGREAYQRMLKGKSFQPDARQKKILTEIVPLFEYPSERHLGELRNPK
jgi:hypothetical protein